MQQLDVSRGTRLNFTANDVPVSGIIIDSGKGDLMCAFVKVATSDSIPDNAQLKIPDLPAAGGCGLAHPVALGGRTVVVLSVGYSHVDFSTIGKSNAV
jgi:hypothetical protein